MCRWTSTFVFMLPSAWKAFVYGNYLCIQKPVCHRNITSLSDWVTFCKWFSLGRNSVKTAKPRASWALFPSRSSADLCKLFYTEQWCGLYGWLLAANPGSSRDLWERKVRGWTAPLRVYDRDNNYCTKHAGWSSGSCSDMLKRQGSWWSHSPLWLMWLPFSEGITTMGRSACLMLDLPHDATPKGFVSLPPINV